MRFWESPPGSVSPAARFRNRSHYTKVVRGSSPITLPRAPRAPGYKAFALDNPDHLVIDIYHKAKDQVRQIGVLDIAISPYRDPPTPPTIPSPTVTEPVRPWRLNLPVRFRRRDPIPAMGKDPAPSDNMGRRKKMSLKVGMLFEGPLSTLPNTRVLMTRGRMRSSASWRIGPSLPTANAPISSLSIHPSTRTRIKGVRGKSTASAETEDQQAGAGSRGAGKRHAVKQHWTRRGVHRADLLTTKKIEHSQGTGLDGQTGDSHDLNGRYSTIDHGVKTVFVPLGHDHAQHSRKSPSCRIRRKRNRCARNRSWRISRIDLQKGQDIPPRNPPDDGRLPVKLRCCFSLT